MELIDGNAVASDLLEELSKKVASFQNHKPCVAFVRVGEDAASVSYVRKKEKTAAKVGIESRLLIFPETMTEDQLVKEISYLNEDSDVHGILVQAPLPPHMDDHKIFNYVLPEKDVDGFNATNLGLLCQENQDAFASCTPAGILELLKRTEVDITGKHVVVLGRSLIVG